MQLLANDSPVIEKAKALCATIASSPEFNTWQGQMNLFMEDENAKTQYRNVQMKGEELQQKQMAGVELNQVEISEFESMRQELLANPTASGFLEAQQGLQGLQETISKYVGLTLELGHVPSDDEIAEANSSGCCGGSGGGSCGC